jgi:sodium/potassium/calcium exchanger 6
MLNMLLGIGISGTYIISQSAVPYDLMYSRTLIVSGMGLLALLLLTLVFVPLNGYYLSRTWGIFLVFCYLAVMATSLVVELAI